MLKAPALQKVDKLTVHKVGQRTALTTHKLSERRIVVCDQLIEQRVFRLQRTRNKLEALEATIAELEAAIDDD